MNISPKNNNSNLICFTAGSLPNKSKGNNSHSKSKNHHQKNNI